MFRIRLVILIMILSVSIYAKDVDSETYNLDWKITKTGDETFTLADYKILNDTATEICIEVTQIYRDLAVLSSKDLSDMPITELSINMKDDELSKTALDFSKENKDCFLINYKELEIGMEFKIGWDSITVVVIGSAQSGIARSSHETIVKDSEGVLHMVWAEEKQPSNDVLVYSNSTDGINWENHVLEHKDTPPRGVSIVVTSDDELIVVFNNQSGNQLLWINFTKGHKNWSEPKTILDDNVATEFSYNPITIDSNDTVHGCLINDSSDSLLYINYTSDGWGNFEAKNKNGADDSDFCDIEVSSNNTILIVSSGLDGDDVDLFKSDHPSWVDESQRITIHSDTSDSRPTISISSSDNYYVSYETDSSDLGFANSSDSLSWSNQVIDSDGTKNFQLNSIKVTEDDSLFIIYEERGANDGIYYANSTDDGVTWDVRNEITPPTPGNDPTPTVRGSLYPSTNRITNEINFNGRNSSTDFIVGKLDIQYIDGADTCDCPTVNTDWEIDLTDNCVITADCHIGEGNLTFSNTGNFYVDAVISHSNIEAIPDGGIIWIRDDGYLNVTSEK